MPAPRPSPLLPVSRACVAAAVWLTLAQAEAAPARPLPNTTPAPLQHLPRADVALEPDGDGRLRYRGEGFDAVIYPDGSVVFREHGAQADLSLFGYDLKRRRWRDPVPDRHEPSWAALRDRVIWPMGQLPVFVGLGGSFGGLADGPRKRRHTGAKKAFMRATEALRFRLAHRWYQTRLQAELAALGGELAEIWRDASLPLAERKLRLFRRWEDCVELTTAKGSELDAMRGEAGRVARAKIERFVRQVAPYGSPQSYTEAELERLNQGRGGRARFRPYDAAILQQDVEAEIELGTATERAPRRP